MRAIFLAAGSARRLRPITNHKPKCLLELSGKAIIDYQIQNLLNAGITESVVVTGFLAEMIETHLVAKHPDMHFIFIRNQDFSTTNPAYSLFLAKDYFDIPFLYLNADVVCHPEIIKQTINCKHPSVTAFQKNAWDEEEVNIILSENDGRVVEMGKHIAQNDSDGEFIGVTKIDPGFAAKLQVVLEDFVEKKEIKKFAADALNVTLQQGEPMFAIDVSAWPAIEIDTPDDLARAENKVLEIKKLVQ